MFDKLRADWRRGRALKFIRPGEDWTYEYKTPAGPIMLVGRFDADGDTLVLTFREMYAKSAMGPEGPHKADVGLGPVRGFLEWVAGMARDLGYTRLRVRGQRTRTRRKKVQKFEFDLAQYRRGHRPSR